MGSVPQAETVPASAAERKPSQSVGKFLRALASALLSIVPGTAAAHRRSRKGVRAEARRRLKVFRGLNSLSQPEKQELFAAVCHMETRLAEIEVAANNLTRTLAILCVVAVGTWKTNWVLYVFHVLQYPLILRLPFRVSLLGFLGWMCPVLLGALAQELRIRGDIALYVSMVVVPVFAWAGLFYADSHWHSWHAHTAIAHHPYIAALAIGSSMFLALLMIATAFSSLRATYSTRRRQEAAGAQLTHLLIEALAYLEREPRRWLEAGRKRSMVQHLERIASCLEHDMVWELNRQRQDVVLWFRKTLAAKAEAVRQLSRWVLTPKGDTREHLLQQLVTLLAASAREELDSFPLVTESNADRRHTIWLRITELLSTLFSAALPGAVVWSTHRVNLLVDPWYGYAVISSILWACVVLMGILDPHYSEHVETVGKIIGAFKPGKSKGE